MKLYKLTERATIPRRSSEGAAGFDLFPLRCHYIEPGERELIPTGIACQLRPGWYGRIAPRSGLAVKHGIDVLAGVIDSDYRGEIKVLLQNHGDLLVELQPHFAMAQIIFEPCWYQNVEVVSDPEKTLVADLAASTKRGTSGFGSTDK
jgi:dUTP pyrophosphatase